MQRWKRLEPDRLTRKNLELYKKLDLRCANRRNAIAWIANRGKFARFEITEPQRHRNRIACRSAIDNKGRDRN